MIATIALTVVVFTLLVVLSLIGNVYQYWGRSKAMPLKEQTVLELLLCKDMYGLELIEQSNGLLEKDTIYVTLQGLEEKGFIHSMLDMRSPVARGVPRRLYNITTKGKQALEEQP